MRVNGFPQETTGRLSWKKAKSKTFLSTDIKRAFQMTKKNVLDENEEL